ncbi:MULTISPECIES: MerR family transcriptional regulator [Actinomadura]|uniref:MerR family transcriptional regulator n=1 Tax=Actinomadura litoris TaxID=2678616 RepID=A0A7K1L6Y9_9ACTN|nr:MULTISPECIES: MerR family transcriptional regulator [Actinomadura]MBT2209501.1 MerR family transcriptional regulator [Actinomadura sp. NEAU-AAG7]MUN40192.1 MerR family transcriptional regulator [Actinomadura litoris]
MRIGELARRTGVSGRSLRYYEQEGLLPAERTPGGHREYAETAVARVRRIQELYAAGLCSSKIVTLLPSLCGEGPAGESLVGELMVERDRIDRMIEDLRRSRSLLDAVIDGARRDGGTGTPAG